MSPLKCSLCSKSSNEFPDYFKVVLSDFKQIFNKLQSLGLNGAEVDKLTFCKSCWIYHMRIHQLHYELRLKKATYNANKTFLATKIRRSQRALLASKESNVASCEDLEVQSSASKDNDDRDSNVIALSLDEDSTATISCSFNNTDESDNESPESCETTVVATTVNVPVSVPEKEPTADKTFVTDSESQPAKAKPKKFIFTYENKWLPKNLTLPKFSCNVEQISATDFLFMERLAFHGTEFGFKCGLCCVVSTFSTCKRTIPWDNLVNHIKKWHMGDQDACKTKTTTQRCIQVGPNRFQYGQCSFEHVDHMYQCGECGILKPPAKSSIHRTSNILKHILDHHNQKISREYICEHCGSVYSSLNSLRGHKYAKHDHQKGQFPCSECGKDFLSRSIVKWHVRRVHLNQRDFTCENCGKAFTRKVNLEIHVASVHKKEKFKCEECGKIFGSQSALKVHMYSHKGKKYSCNICGMDFTQGYSVTRHKKTAHNE